MPTTQSPCKNHDHHLCKLTSDGLHKADPKKYHQLVQNPEYVCKSCGRVAASKESLCTPAKLGTFED